MGLRTCDMGGLGLCLRREKPESVPTIEVKGKQYRKCRRYEEEVKRQSERDGALEADYVSSCTLFLNHVKGGRLAGFWRCVIWFCTRNWPVRAWRPRRLRKRVEFGFVCLEVF